jgi:hypothetical protein
MGCESNFLSLVCILFGCVSSTAGHDEEVAMDLDELLLLSDLNMVEFYRELTRRSPKGTILEEDGLLLYAGAHPSPLIVNGAIRTTSDLSATEVLDRAQKFFGSRGHGYCVVAAAHTDADLEAAARGGGYRMILDLTAMVLVHRLDDRPAPAGAVLRRATDAASVQDFAEVTAEAFNDREMVMATFAEPPILFAPHIAAFVAYLNGAPVSAAMTMVIAVPTRSLCSFRVS